MRFEGVVQSWNDERGFGFIAADQGGEPVFVHIKAFGAGARRPQVQQRVSFDVELGPQGKKRARSAQLLTGPRNAAAAAAADARQLAASGRHARASVRASGARFGTASLFAIPALVVLAAVLGLLWRPPLWLLWWYVGLSVVTYVVYYADKSAAQRGSWRTAENTLHLLALGGGWPGALLAQQRLRHKSAKASFRAVFWLTVLANVAALVYVCAPAGRHLLPASLPF